jgi:DNA polymerase-3 subunit delta
LSKNGYRDLSSHIEKGLFDKAYLFSGRDKDRKGEAIAIVEAALKSLFEGSISLIRIRVDESTPEEIAAHLFTVPLFEKCKLIIVPGIESADKGSRDILLDFVKNPSEGLYLVACTDQSSWELSRKGPAFLKKFRDQVRLFDFSPPREAELRGRARDLAKNLGFHIEDDALEKILTRSGNDFDTIRNEMEKLSLFIDPGGKAGLEEVDSVISRGGDVDVWELAEALSRRDMSRAQITTHELLISGEKPVQIIGALWYNMVRMAWCRALLDSGVDEREIGNRLNIKTWRLKKLLSQASGFSAEEYHTILNILFELDVAVRSRGGDIEPVFSRGIAEMVHGPGRRA